MKPMAFVLALITWRMSQPSDQVKSWLAIRRAEATPEVCGLSRCTPFTVGSTRRVISSTTASTAAAVSAPASARRTLEIEIDEFIRAPRDGDEHQCGDHEQQRAGVHPLQKRPRRGESRNQFFARAGEQLLRVRRQEGDQQAD